MIAGVLGGFTTYSSFNLETLRLVEEAMWGKAALYSGGTFVLCLAAGFAGLALGSPDGAHRPFPVATSEAPTTGLRPERERRGWRPGRAGP